MSAKTRGVLLVISICTIVLVAALVFRGRDPRVIVSIKPPIARPAANQQTGTQHANTPPPIAARNTGTVQVCGYGPVSIDKNDYTAIVEHVGALGKRAGVAWLSALQNSGDLRARVAGLLLEGKVTGGESLRPIAEQTRNEVVQLAAGSGDPAVYAMALSMCDASAATDADSACRQLSLQRWAQMDPDNAVPWLLLAGKARARHDSAAEADAFSHAAAAHKSDSYNNSVFAFAEPEMPQDITPLERAYLATEVIGIETAIGWAHNSVASQHCSSDAMQNGRVRQECGSLAELLASKSTNLLDLGLAKTIGARAGWAAERVKALVLEQHALMQAIRQQTLPGSNDELWSCDAVNRVNTYMIERVRQGELGAARDTLARSGETAEAMASKYTQYLDDMNPAAPDQEQQDSAAISQ